jgi:hypothetical protein
MLSSYSSHDNWRPRRPNPEASQGGVCEAAMRGLIIICRGVGFDRRSYRKRELQKALFPAGLTWFQKKRAFETSQTVSIDDIDVF